MVRPYKWRRKKLPKPNKYVHTLTFESGNPSKPCLDGVRIIGVRNAKFEKENGSTGIHFGFLKLDLIVKTDEGWTE